MASGKMQGGEITKTWQRGILELARSTQGWREFVSTPRNRIAWSLPSTALRLSRLSLARRDSNRNNIVHNKGNFCLSYGWIHLNREE